MPDILDLPLRRAVGGTVSSLPPDFEGVYIRAGRRTKLRWSAVGLTVVAAAALTVAVLKPVPPPDFHRQVTAFVDIVYRD